MEPVDVLSALSSSKEKGEIDDNFTHMKANSSQHNFVFAAWLVKTYGQNFLRKGEGVLDVAGGAGMLSYELTVRYGVNSTVLDSRKIQLNSMLKRKMRYQISPYSFYIENTLSTFRD